MALIKLLEEINCIDDKKYAMGIFDDLKKKHLMMSCYLKNWRGMTPEGLL